MSKIPDTVTDAAKKVAVDTGKVVAGDKLPESSGIVHIVDTKEGKFSTVRGTDTKEKGVDKTIVGTSKVSVVNKLLKLMVHKKKYNLVALKYCVFIDAIILVIPMISMYEISKN